ncbi:AIR synthase-related protein, sll0787 family [Xenococcus sp. PCC 7305]|uniref:sll0787 family AIR synthase-like protein n=1 Tax=Xenococcus sp. PCC 7305 TaxID=102125 RepID=UPI0002ABD94C|nr:sll0787 family AIR synthase-like protein [Xenococcus sp. PCC 7305]ELS04193.1 AIR synthase-related protein, sll0787 family [Xenococcus sp. PCC 7305]
MKDLELKELAAKLRKSLGIVHKQDIQIPSQILGLTKDSTIAFGDDCAAIPDSDGYLLLAAEGIWDVLVASDPWFAGWCAVMVNVSDIAAMGGRAIAVVDTIWTEDREKATPLLDGMKAAAQAFKVPIVGGHTNLKSAYNALSVAILGRAQKLISSFTAQPGDLLIVAIDLQGTMHPQFPFWNAATQADPLRLQQNLQILPYLAENGLCYAGKDISMGGIVGTLLMLIEASHCGAILDLDQVFCPPDICEETWLSCFPSYGFLLSIRPEHIDTVQEKFAQQNITCAVVGEMTQGSELILQSQGKTHLFWNWQLNKLIG